jgi:hypothetical protein
MTHGLHLNSRGKRELTYLIAETISGGHVSSVSSIPVITHTRALPFLSLKLKAQRCLTCFECNYLQSVNTKFLGLQIDNHLNWKNHIDQMVPKLSGA